MSPEAQQEAICKAVGYYLIEDEESSSISLRHPTDTMHYPWHRIGHEQFCWEDGPDYLTDLNAMHEAVLSLPAGKQFDWQFQLMEVINALPGSVGPFGNATAAQRAEAFLRTIGKWDDSK